MYFTQCVSPLCVIAVMLQTRRISLKWFFMFNLEWTQILNDVVVLMFLYYTFPIYLYVVVIQKTSTLCSRH